MWEGPEKVSPSWGLRKKSEELMLHSKQSEEFMLHCKHSKPCQHQLHSPASTHLFPFSVSSWPPVLFQTYSFLLWMTQNLSQPSLFFFQSSSTSQSWNTLRILQSQEGHTSKFCASVCWGWDMRSGLRDLWTFYPHHHDISVINNMYILNIYCTGLFLHCVDGWLWEGIHCGSNAS